jgi:hypothetical protein
MQEQGLLSVQEQISGQPMLGQPVPELDLAWI